MIIDAERIKKRYPKGTRIRLKRRMNDPYTPVPRGTIGTVKLVDDAGTLFMEWDNGSTLGLLPDVDDFEVVHR